MNCTLLPRQGFGAGQCFQDITNICDLQCPKYSPIRELYRSHPQNAVLEGWGPPGAADSSSLLPRRPKAACGSSQCFLVSLALQYLLPLFPWILDNSAHSKFCLYFTGSCNQGLNGRIASTEVWLSWSIKDILDFTLK